MSPRPLTRRRPDHEPVVRYRPGAEPGDRRALIEGLAELLVGMAAREAGEHDLAAAAPREAEA